MTQTSGPTAGPAPSASGLDRFFDWLRSLDLRRDSEDKWLAGVCSGIANRLGVDPIVIRAAVVLLVIMGGVGITIYLVAWGFLANDRDEIIAERAIRHGDVLGIILLVVIALSLVGGTGFADDGPGFVWFWWLVLPVALVVWLVRRGRDGAKPAIASTPAGAWTPPTSGQEQTMSYAAPPAPPGTAPIADGPAVGGAPPQAPMPPAPTTPRQPRAPRPPRPPRRRTAGFVGAVLVGGLSVAIYGLTLWLHDAGNWPGSDETVALAAALAVFGIALVGLGIAGFRAGLTALMAVLLALVTWTASVVPNLSLGGGLGDRVWRPAATDSAKEYRLGIGSAELDLADVADNPASPRQIEAGVGIGELRIRVPENLTVEVRSSVGAGDIAQFDPDAAFGPLEPGQGDQFDSTTHGNGGRDITRTQTFGSGSPDAVVTAHVGIGQILIGKE